MKKKFEYFLNAIHYSLWLLDIKLGDSIRKVTRLMLLPIPKLFFTDNFRKKYYANLQEGRKQLEKFYYDKRNGAHIGSAHHWFGFFYSGYPGYIGFIIIGLLIGGCANFKEIYLLTYAIPVGLCYVPAYKAVFSNDRYLKFFNEFEKEDDAWHKKWKRRTIAFIIGSIAITLLGIATTFFIAIKLTEYRNMQ